MTKPSVSPETVLSRIDKLLAKGSFQAAKRELEKSGMNLERPDLAEKLRRCNEEVAKQRASEMVKKARRCLKHDKLKEALKLFAAAHEITKEAWLKEKIDQLQTELQCASDENAALEAEQRGDYLAAADLYGRSGADGANEEALLNKAHCLVMACEWEAAVSAYRVCEPKHDRDLYELGLARVMTGQYEGCLDSWSSISSADRGFIAQKDTVCRLAALDFHRKLRFDDDCMKIYEGLRVLLSRADHPDLRRELSHCRCRLLERYWREEQYDAVLALIEDAGDIDGMLLEIAAKASFLLLSETKTDLSAPQLNDFAMYWLTALHHPEIEMQLSADIEESSRMRSRLIERAELLVRSRADSCDGDAKEIVARWESERAVTEEIYGMTRDLPGPPRGICTPRFAARFGKAGGMLALIRRCSVSQEGERHLLDLGAWYSEAAPVLFCGLDGDIDKASEMLAPGQPDDPFSELALRRAAFICGLRFLDTADNKALKHFRTAAPLFETSKVFEEQLIEKVFEVEEMESLKLCEQVLALIVDEHPTGGLKRTLSTVSTRLAIDRCNRGEMGLDAFTRAIERALELDPANEEALIAKGDAQADLEIKALNQALERHKMARACEIVERSQHPETRETFFTFMENIFDLLSRNGMTRAESVFMLNDLYKWCERVDPEHPFLDEIGKELVALGQG